MKNLILLLCFLTFTAIAYGQTSAEPTSNTTKKSVQIAGKWYIETTTISKQYTELNTQILLDVDNEALEAKAEDEEVQRKQEERAKKKAERIERNQLLKDAMQKGYKPEPQTLEEQEKLKKVRAKLGIKQ